MTALMIVFNVLMCIPCPTTKTKPYDHSCVLNVKVENIGMSEWNLCYHFAVHVLNVAKDPVYMITMVIRLAKDLTQVSVLRVNQARIQLVLWHMQSA